MAALCVVSQCAALPSSSLALHSSSCAAFGGSATLGFSLHGAAATQAKNGRLTVRASSSSEANCTRRDAVVAGGSALLAGLLLVLPAAGPAEARTVNPGVRRRLRAAVDKLKAEAGKGAEDVKESVKEVANKVKAAGKKVASN